MALTKPQKYGRAVDKYKPSGWTQVHRGATEKDDEKRVDEAIPLWKIGDLKFKIGQRMRITLDRKEDGLQKARAVVVGDYGRYVLLDAANRTGRVERVTILKADILRRKSGMSIQDKGGGLRIELY